MPRLARCFTFGAGAVNRPIKAVIEGTMTRAIFLGKPIYLLLWLAVIGVLAGVGDMQMHLSFFNAFIFVVLALAMAVVIIVVVA